MVRVASITAGLGIVALLVFGNCSKSEPTQTALPPGGGGATTTGAPGGVMAKGGAPEGAVGASADRGPDSSFQLATEQAAPASAGVEAIARLVVHPGAGYKMNMDFPTKLTLEPPAGVTLAKTVLEPGDAESFSEKGLAFAVKMTAPAAGEYTIPATLKFAVCTEATCDPKKQKIALVLKAN